MAKKVDKKKNVRDIIIEGQQVANELNRRQVEGRIRQLEHQMAGMQTEVSRLKLQLNTLNASP